MLALASGGPAWRSLTDQPESVLLPSEGTQRRCEGRCLWEPRSGRGERGQSWASRRARGPRCSWLGLWGPGRLHVRSTPGDDRCLTQARPAAHGQQPYVVPNGSTECVSRCCQRRGSGRERKFRSRGISLSGWPKVSVPLPFLRALDSGLLWGDPGQVRLRPSAYRFAQRPLTPPEAPRGPPCMQPTGRPKEHPCLE